MSAIGFQDRQTALARLLEALTELAKLGTQGLKEELANKGKPR
jgi:hypothetical protein